MKDDKEKFDIPEDDDDLTKLELGESKSVQITDEQQELFQKGLVEGDQDALVAFFRDLLSDEIPDIATSNIRVYDLTNETKELQTTMVHSNKLIETLDDLADAGKLSDQDLAVTLLGLDQGLVTEEEVWAELAGIEIASPEEIAITPGYENPNILH